MENLQIPILNNDDAFQRNEDTIKKSRSLKKVLLIAVFAVCWAFAVFRQEEEEAVV
jgi:hypothetical protein